jgi:CO dehydrogenase maturation factor
MSAWRVAITGKGGTGKTTVAALMVRSLAARGLGPVLAVDADPNTCLDAALGMSVPATVGRVREQAREAVGKGLAVGTDKQALLEMRIAESLVEGAEYDLIAMGRSEGPGCYCYANNVLKSVIARLADSYRWVVIDNEAGLENLSRRIAPEVDGLVIVSDHSAQGLRTALRLHGLAAEMGIRYGTLALVVNRCRNGSTPAGAADVAAVIGAGIVTGLPDDGELAGLSEAGQDLARLSADNPVARGVDELVGRLCGGA